MKRKLTILETISITSMLFGLFFGAGNLIFPAYMGQSAGANVWPALLGFLITGVGMPLLAVISLGLTGSKGLLDMSSRISKPFGYFFTCALYLTIGPFFACPRCITVPFEVGIKRLVPSSVNEHISLLIFSLIFFGLILYFSLRPGKILVWIGKILNPIFIIVLGILVITALVHPAGSISSFTPLSNYQGGALSQGVLDGYNTMDTLAGLAFGIIVVDVIKKLGIEKDDDVAKSTVKAGLFSCLFMAFIYILVALAGAASRGYAAESDNGGAVLYSIANHYFPSFGPILLAAIVFFACLKTIIGLVTSCATTFSEMFPKFLSYNKWVVLFSSITFAIANVGLTSIIQISLPVLMMLYPLAITLTLLTLGSRIFGHHQEIGIPVMTSVFISSIFYLIRALPASWISAIHAERMIQFLEAYLPFYKIGFGWICPAALGLLIGFSILLVQKVSQKSLKVSHKGGMPQRPLVR